MIDAGVVTGNQSGGGLFEPLGATRHHFNLPKIQSMSEPIITIHYKDHPIRIIGLPDYPKFIRKDLSRLVPHSGEILEQNVEVFITDNGQAVNLAGVYRILFWALDTLGESDHTRELEIFFVKQVEPALRKYGFPSRTVPAELNRN